MSFPFYPFPSTYQGAGRSVFPLAGQSEGGDGRAACLVHVVYTAHFSSARSYCLLVYLKPALASELTFCPFLPLLPDSLWHSILVPFHLIGTLHCHCILLW